MNQKYVLITGASRGIGRACALAFARNHFHVFLNCRHSLDALQQVEKEILDEHGSCTLLQWSEILNTNLSSVFYCCRSAISHMVSQKSGKIINISSMWGTVGASCEAAYSATKSGMNGLTKALAKELAPSNVQVNAIACGVIDTAMNAQFSEEEREALREEIPAGRFADSEEVAALALTLASGHSYLTGQIIGLDGGYI